ncbi:hypothetical protein [uncultured Salinisphaera sp.]|uniref:hypothetical protein n=1 Tax=uncultured Salinisphaera sp. TaxID=359372 RepID=UPI0032B10170|tara:strand:- start:2338 stop:2871 length:534 start_codon:yes stop_codon:yes gene_type:complete
MRRSVLIPAAALAVLTVSATAQAQSDETFDASSVGATPEADANDVVDDSGTDREDRAAALSDSIAAEEARMQGGDKTRDDAAPGKTLPKPKTDDYGADDFRAPSDDELSAATEKARAAKAASGDDQEPSSNDVDRAPANDADRQRPTSTSPDDTPADKAANTDQSDRLAPAEDRSSE